MIKCKDCKAFSPQSEYGGICDFTNFGTVKNDDGCHAGAIINDIYNLSREEAIDEFADALKDKCDENPSRFNTYTFTCIDEVAEILKERR